MVQAGPCTPARVFSITGRDDTGLGGSVGGERETLQGRVTRSPGFECRLADQNKLELPPNYYFLRDATIYRLSNIHVHPKCVISVDGGEVVDRH